MITKKNQDKIRYSTHRSSSHKCLVEFIDWYFTWNTIHAIFWRQIGTSQWMNKDYKTWLPWFYYQRQNIWKAIHVELTLRNFDIAGRHISIQYSHLFRAHYLLESPQQLPQPLPRLPEQQLECCPAKSAG